MNKIDRIKELVELLNKASDAYYNSGHPIMEDREFDALLEELEVLENDTNFVLSNSPTRNVGAEIRAGLNEVEHAKPMLSLKKCHSAQELIDFAGDDNCYLSVKCDGLTTRLIYENGELVGAETRGDGIVGQDVLFHVKEFVNVPIRIPYNRFVIDGESVIFYSDFEKINEPLPEDEKFANPRNLASGTLDSHDANITRQRKVRFIAWRVIEGIDIDSNYFKLMTAKEAGFTIAPMYTYSNNSTDKEHIEEMLHSLRKQANDMGLPMDGIVMAKDSEELAISMGRTEKYFRHSIAYKFEDERYETKLLGIDWTMGRTGVLTPTAVFEPVEIDGTTVERALLHNISIIKDLGLTNSCTVKVYKSNQIIPQIDSCEADGNGDIEIPALCPICGGATAIQKENDTEVLICTNSDCSGKLLGKFENFVSRKAMNIDGLSTATLELFISNGYLKDFIDIYALSTRRDKLVTLPGFGAKSVEKLLQAIEKSRKVKLSNYIVALGIPGIGSSAAKTISDYFHGDYYAFEDAMTDRFDWTKLSDFGQKTSDSINKWWSGQTPEVYFLPTELEFEEVEEKIVEDNPFTGKTLCVTGKLHHFTRDSINEKIASLGAKAASSVSKKTDWLITNEASGSSKYKKAVELGVPVITEDEFLKMIGE